MDPDINTEEIKWYNLEETFNIEHAQVISINVFHGHCCCCFDKLYMLPSVFINAVTVVMSSIKQESIFT